MDAALDSYFSNPEYYFREQRSGPGAASAMGGGGAVNSLDKKKIEQMFNKYRGKRSSVPDIFSNVLDELEKSQVLGLNCCIDPSEPNKIGMEGCIRFLEDLKLDASAGIGIAQRRGAGRIRHIATPTLWLQKAVSDGKVKVSKLAGKENPADLGTKYVGRKDIEKIWKTCGFQVLKGDSKIALKAAI